MQQQVQPRFEDHPIHDILSDNYICDNLFKKKKNDINTGPLHLVSDVYIFTILNNFYISTLYSQSVRVLTVPSRRPRTDRLQV